MSHYMTKKTFSVSGGSFELADFANAYKIEKAQSWMNEVFIKNSQTASGVATGGLRGRVPPLVPRTDCGIRPDPMRSW